MKLNDDVILMRVDFWNKRWWLLKNSGMLEKMVVYLLGYLLVLLYIILF